MPNKTADPGGAGAMEFHFFVLIEAAINLRCHFFFQLPIPLKLYSRFMGRLLPVLLVTSQRKNGLGLFLATQYFDILSKKIGHEK